MTLGAMTAHESTGQALEVDHLSVYIGELHILEDVTLRASKGRCTALLGRNGSGKTTTLKSIMGLVPPAGGTVTFYGRDITGRPAHEVARLGIGYVPEDRGVFTGLTVRENLLLAQRKRDDERLRRVVGLFSELGPLLDRRAGTLSGGERQMVATARALVNPVRLLLIDEPSKGLAPRALRRLAELLAEVKREATVLLVEQNFFLAAELADHCYVLDSGRTVYEGPMSELEADEETRRKYLGVA